MANIVCLVNIPKKRNLGPFQYCTRYSLKGYEAFLIYTDISVLKEENPLSICKDTD